MTVYLLVVRSSPHPIHFIVSDVGKFSVRAVLNRKRPAPELRLCNRVSHSRLARLDPNDLAIELRASADTAIAEGLAGSTRQVYSSHVNYFFEFCQLITLDMELFGAAVRDGGLSPTEEETVRDTVDSAVFPLSYIPLFDRCSTCS